MREDLILVYGNEKTEQIIRQATLDYNKLLNEYRNLPKAIKTHTSLIFAQVSVYRILKQDNPHQAMELMDTHSRKSGAKKRKMFLMMLKLPVLKHLFIRIFTFCTKNMFGDKNGFQVKFRKTTKKELQFDIMKCPYCEYCTKCGCSELTKVFCDNDIYSYQNLPRLKFVRNETLGISGERCDFYYSQS